MSTTLDPRIPELAFRLVAGVDIDIRLDRVDSAGSPVALTSARLVLGGDLRATWPIDTTGLTVIDAVETAGVWRLPGVVWSTVGAVRARLEVDGEPWAVGVVTVHTTGSVSPTDTLTLADGDGVTVTLTALADGSGGGGGGGGVPTSRQIIAGSGLSGGGDLTADRTLSAVFGSTAGTVTEGDDARLSDARVPTAHAATHGTAGSDPLTPAAIGAATAAQGSLADTALQPDDLDTLRPDHTSGAPFTAAGLDDWFSALAAAGTTPVDVVCIGDSFGVINGVQSWGYLLEQHVAGARSNTKVPIGWRYAKDSNSFVPQFTTNAGTENEALTGGSGTTLTTGQKATLVAPADCDGLSLIYRTATGAGSIIVRDGVGGPTLTTIDTNAATSTQRWTSAALIAGARTFEFEASGGAVGIDGAYMHNGNRTSGVRFWQACRIGETSNGFTTNSGRALDLISALDTAGTLALVIIGTGTNDGANASAWYTSLLSAVQTAAPGVPVVKWQPYKGSTFASYHAASLATVQASGIPYVDGDAIMPDFLANSAWNAGDNVHPTVAGERMIATPLASLLTGSPLDLLARLDEQRLPLAGGTLTGNLKAADIISSTGWLALQASGVDRWLGNKNGALNVTDTSLDVLFGNYGSGVMYAGRRQQINAQTGTAYTAANADKAKVITRSNPAASTHTWPSDASASLLVVGTIIEVRNVGAGTVTHQAGSGATVTGTLGQAPDTVATAVKTAANTWHVVSSQPSTAGGTSVPSLPRVSGQYYTLGGAESASTTLHYLSASGRIAAHPVWLPAGSYDQIGVYVGTVAAATWRLGVYPTNPATLSPEGQTLLIDCGTIDMSTSTGLRMISTSFTIPSTGVYWLAGLVDAHTATPSVTGWAGSAGATPNLPWFGHTALGSPAGRGSWVYVKTGVTTGAMPATFPASPVKTDQSPQIIVRAT